MQKSTSDAKATARSPIVAIMGHIDHGKSTLLSYIRKSKEPLNEAGGITQHVSAYEISFDSKDSKQHKITFIDTPGHEAFSGIRKRGAKVADIAILVVSAEDGVKPQTLDALNSIVQSNTPYIVAINKIDKAGANVEKTKQNLLENQIYLEGLGGNIPFVLVSAKTGEGVPELLEMIGLVAELEELTGNTEADAEGVILESNLDVKKGISATCVIKNGTLEKGMYVVSGIAISPVRIMEDYLGKNIDSATFSSPIKIIGWDSLPFVGDSFKSYNNREDARAASEKERAVRLSGAKNKEELAHTSYLNSVYLIVKADTASSLEAVVSEIKKLSTEKTEAKVIFAGIGTISENDVRLSNGTEKGIVIGFNTKIDSPAKNLAERNEVEVKTFDVIYKLLEWVKETITVKTPKVKEQESVGSAKILKIFSKVKDKQILGGRVEKGTITLGSQIKVIRRDAEIADGRIRDLQQMKAAVNEVKEGKEFGALIECKIEIVPGDKIENFIIVEK